MTNQASEDIRGAIRTAISKDFETIYVKEFTTNWKIERLSRNLEIGVMDFDAIQSLIRTEKLKLLAEVRERVVGENQHSEHKEWDCPCGATHSFTEEWHATNRLRDEQRVALSKLEAEL